MQIYAFQNILYLTPVDLACVYLLCSVIDFYVIIVHMRFLEFFLTAPHVLPPDYFIHYVILRLGLVRVNGDIETPFGQN